MAEMLNNIGQRFRDSLKSRKVQIVGLLTGAAMAAPALAADDTFNFSILEDLGTSLLTLAPTANSLLDAGGPLVIKFCVIAAVCAPFVWVYYKVY